MSADRGAVRFDQHGHIATITIDRPHKRNSVTPEMGRALFPLAERINTDDAIRVVIVTGAGDTFSAGSDVELFDEYGTNWQLRNRADYNRALWSVRKPLIAAVRGHAVGGGLEMALTCDIRIASTTARFGAGEIRLGFHGGAGNTQLLPRLIGFGKALQMLLTGDLIDAAEAYRVGLVQEIVPDEELKAAAHDLAERIARNAPIAVQLTKHLVRVSESTSLEVGLAYENDLFAYCFTTDATREGIAAFREKRGPTFGDE